MLSLTKEVELVIDFEDKFWLRNKLNDQANIKIITSNNPMIELSK